MFKILQPDLSGALFGELSLPKLPKKARTEGGKAAQIKIIVNQKS
jgi:hypothetical protein